MEQKGSNILEGEASESDEEVADYPSFIQNTMVLDFTSTPVQQKNQSMEERSSGVVISGEASESDEEESFEYARSTLSRDFPSLVGLSDRTQMELEVDHGSTDETSKYRDEYKRPKFKSPFHKRMRENNFYLRCGVVENTLDTYENAAHKLKGCIPVLSKTQTATQDTLHDLRFMIESLNSMKLRNDYITNASLLPRFKELESLKLED